MENLNKLVLQSYKLTTLRNDFGLYAQRLLVRIVEAMQYRLEDANFRDLPIKAGDKRLWWEFKLSDIMDAGSHNHTKVKSELRKVIKAGIYYEIDKNYWGESAVYTDIIFENGTVKVKINDTVWDLFIEMSKGYKRYELKTAFELKSTYSLRLYQLLSENADPITYTIDWLKEMFQVKDKYKNPFDFIRKVIEPAKKELEEVNAPTTFTYEPVKTASGRGRPQITAITFFPVKNPQVNFDVRAKEINRKYGMAVFPTEVKRKLIEGYNFSENGIRANSDIFMEAHMSMSNPTLLEFLDMKRAQAMKAGNPQGWIINALKQILSNSGQ